MPSEEWLATTCTKIRDLGWLFYFTEPTTGRARELGLDGFRFYFLGRGGVLGDVEASVIVSAFGFFEPDLVTRMWNSAREVLPARQGGTEFVRCCQEHGRRELSDVDGLEAFCAAAGAVNQVAARSLAGHTLYAGWSTAPLPDDPPARAMQLLTVLREWRGSAHVASVSAIGLDPSLAHFIARPEMWGAFGYPDDEQPIVTDVDVARLAEAEVLTDRQVLPAYDILDASAQIALLDGLEAIEAALTTSY